MRCRTLAINGQPGGDSEPTRDPVRCQVASASKLVPRESIPSWPVGSSSALALQHQPHTLWKGAAARGQHTAPTSQRLRASGPEVTWEPVG